MLKSFNCLLAVIFVLLCLNSSFATEAEVPQALTSSELSGQAIPQSQSLNQGGQQVVPQSTNTEIQQPTNKGEITSTEPESMSSEQSSSSAEVSESEATSSFENYLSGKGSMKVSTKLTQFGYNLFRKPPSTFAPVTNIPVGPEYIIGPGDEIRITVWGKVEGRWSVKVDRDGNIIIPKIGIMPVAGLTFKELKEVLLKEFEKYYKGFEMNVSMGALRSITVYVVGNARRPGAYTVSSLSTLVNALFVAGGPSKTGSMRDIQVKRNGMTIVHFDLYDFLLRGDKTKDIRLMPEDVIFIPPVGPLVGVAGMVKRPAIYELKGHVRLLELIEMAGGLMPTGYLSRVQVERIYDNEVKVLVDADLKHLTEQENIVLQDGDLVKVYPITNVIVNAVELVGNVTRPGKYQWFKGMRVSDIIKEPDKDLLPETYMEQALITRLVPPDYHPELILFNLKKAIFDRDKTEDKLLEPYDKIRIYNKWEMVNKEEVRVSGAVNKPGTYKYYENMKVSDLINLAGGLKYFAYMDKAELTRVTPTERGPITKKIIINLRKALSGDPYANIPLKQDDYLIVRAVPEWQLYQKVTIKGEVRFPGVYTIKKGERLSDLIKRAGGFTERAYLQGAVFTRERVKELQQKQIEEMVDRLERELLSSGTSQIATASSPDEAKMLQLELQQKRQFISRLRTIRAKGRIAIRIMPPEKLKNTSYDIELEDGDSIYIPTDPQTVQVIGSVYNQTAFVYEKGRSYQYYIDLAGGYTENADTDNVYILKADGSAMKVHNGLLHMSWNEDRFRWETGGAMQLESGDTIVVPEKLERIAWMRNIKDITQILYQIAVTAGVAIAAF